MSYSGLLFNRPMNKTVCEQAGAELKQIECKKPFYIGFFVAFFDKNNPVFWDKFWIPDKIYFMQPCRWVVYVETIIMPNTTSVEMQLMLLNLNLFTNIISHIVLFLGFSKKRLFPRCSQNFFL